MLFFCLMSNNISAQHQPFYDYDRKIHFGFTLGTNFASFRYEFSDNFYKTDSILGIKNISYPGLTLGAIANWHIGENFDLRFLPALILTQRSVNYRFHNDREIRKDVESVLVEFPITAKYKSQRHMNVRFYVLGGMKYSYDMASNASSFRDPSNPILAINPHNLNYEFGFGFDFFFPYFKFAPEIKISRGIFDILAPDQSIYSQVFQGLKSQFVYISFHFE